MFGGLQFLLYLTIGLLVVLIFKGPIIGFWQRLSGEFERNQDLERKANSSRHGHFYLTIEKYDRETPEVEEVQSAEGATYRFDGNEFSNLEAAEFARYNAILAKARGYYTDIDVWTQSLPGPGQFKRKR